MINELSDLHIVVRTPVPDRHRSITVAEIFCDCYALQFEPYLYAIAAALSAEYRGAYWDFFVLSGGGFYQAPDDDRTFVVRCENGYEGTLSADALGITCCLYAYSHLSFAENGEIARVYARLYHVLREHMLAHAEVAEILRATD